MIIQPIVKYDRAERDILKTASSWVMPEDCDPSTDYTAVRLLVRGEGSMSQVYLAAAELQRCKERLSRNTLVGLPAPLVAEGADLEGISKDIWEVALREMTPAADLLEKTVQLMQRVEAVVR